MQSYHRVIGTVKLMAAIFTVTYATKLFGGFRQRLNPLKHIAVTASLVTAISLSPVSAENPNPLADVGLKEFLVKDGNQFLRIAQPVFKDGQIRLGASRKGDVGVEIQENIELVRLRLEQVGVTNPTAWGKVATDEGLVETLLKKSKDKILSQSKNSEAATAILDEKIVPELAALVDAIRLKQGPETLMLQEQVAHDLSTLRSLALPDDVLPYTIPQEYANLPALQGMATVELTIKSNKGFRLDDSKTITPTTTFILTLDGYHAPLTAGNFVDLVDRKFYNGMTLQKVEELTVQTGKPSDGRSDGFIDPKTKELRTIPLELFYKQDSQPVYGITSDDDSRATETMALPFQAYGAVGMARDNEDPDSASSQFFLLKWRQALIAPGRNTIDGFYSCFGYITSPNAYLLAQLTPADTIVAATVTEGLQHLKR